MEKILVIDDEKSILDLLSVVFEKEGYMVETSLSATRAVELMGNEDFDIIVSDIKMPKMSGMELLSYVRKNRPDIPIVMITAYGTIKQAVEALKAGAMDYIVKPFDVEELKIIVAQGLEKKRLKEENLFLKKELKKKYDFENMIGKSKMMHLFRLTVEPSPRIFLKASFLGTSKGPSQELWSTKRACLR